MVKDYILEPIQGMPAWSWIFLGLLIIACIGVHCKMYYNIKCNDREYKLSLYLKQNISAIFATLILVYLAILFSATVVARVKTMEPYYELIPFWSWKQAIQDIINEKDYLLATQILMTILIFMPIGFCIHSNYRIDKYSNICYSD